MTDRKHYKRRTLLFFSRNQHRRDRIGLWLHLQDRRPAEGFSLFFDNFATCFTFYVFSVVVVVVVACCMFVGAVEEMTSILRWN